VSQHDAPLVTKHHVVQTGLFATCLLFQAQSGVSSRDPTNVFVPRCVLFLLCVVQRMLLEAAVYGAVLFGVEQRLDTEYGYKLSARKDREEQAGKPPL
jgi:hypothetical protein